MILALALQEQRLLIASVEGVDISNLAYELRLTAVARMANSVDRQVRQNPIGYIGSIISNRNDVCWPQHSSELVEYFFTGFSLQSVMRPVAERVAGLMRMKRKHVPEEHASFNAT